MKRDPVLFKGSPGSPYTRKMLAYLRYRHIPYRLLLGGHDVHFDLPRAKVNLLPTFYLPNAAGEIEAVVDSTPLIRRFEREYADQQSDRDGVPPSPVLAFIDYLIEDFADEWLTKAMFHYRWSYAADIEKAGRVLPWWSNITAAEDVFETRRRVFSERQVGRLYVVGSNPATAPVIEASYRRVLELFDGILRQQPFLMGGRPGASDFALYAQLTQLAKFDPTPAELTLATTPRVYAWVDVVDDLSGLEPQPGDWLADGEIEQKLRPLLTEIGRGYAPVMLANAAAQARGAERFEVAVEGVNWVQQTFPYQARCVQWLRERYAMLDDEDRATVAALLEGTGCNVLVADART